MPVTGIFMHVLFHIPVVDFNSCLLDESYPPSSGMKPFRNSSCFSFSSRNFGGGHKVLAPKQTCTTTGKCVSTNSRSKEQEH